MNVVARDYVPSICRIVPAVFVLSLASGLFVVPGADAQPLRAATYLGSHAEGDAVRLVMSRDGLRLIGFVVLAPRFVSGTQVLSGPGMTLAPEGGIEIQDGEFEATEAITLIDPAGPHVARAELRVWGWFPAPGRAEGTLEFLGIVVPWSAEAAVREAPGSNAPVVAPAAVLLAPGATTAFVDVRQPAPAADPVNGEPRRPTPHVEPGYVDVRNDGDAAVIVFYDGATLIIRAPEGRVARVVEGCRRADEPGPLVRCDVSGSFLKGMVRVVFTLDEVVDEAGAA
jgi:hypothetical protein